MLQPGGPALAFFYVATSRADAGLDQHAIPLLKCYLTRPIESYRILISPLRMA
jgi:hypothetical protein